MVKVDVRADIRDITENIRALKTEIQDRFTVRALNRAGTTMRNAEALEIQKTYGAISIAKIKKYLWLRDAARAAQSVELHVRGGRLPLIAFNALQWKQVGGGVSVVTGKGNFFVPHAFIATMRSGHKGVFIRAEAAKGSLWDKVKFRSGRVRKKANDLPIAELFARSLPEIVLKGGTQERVVRLGQERFLAEFEGQVKRLLEKQGTAS